MCVCSVLSPVLTLASSDEDLQSFGELSKCRVLSCLLVPPFRLLEWSPPLLSNVIVIFFGNVASLSFSKAIKLIFTETEVLFCWVSYPFTG